MMENDGVEFGTMDIGDEFRADGILYEKTADDTARILRDEQGLEPAKVTQHCFYPENVVERVTGEDAQNN